MLVPMRGWILCRKEFLLGVTLVICYKSSSNMCDVLQIVSKELKEKNSMWDISNTSYAHIYTCPKMIECNMQDTEYSKYLTIRLLNN